jgi:hypothetical protein
MFSYSTGYYVSPPDDQYLKFKNRCSLVAMQLKFLLYPTYCCQALGQNAQPCKVPVNIYLYFHLLISVCPKTKTICMCR